MSKPEDSEERIARRLQERGVRPGIGDGRETGERPAERGAGRETGRPSGLTREDFAEAGEDVVRWAETLIRVDGQPLDYSGRWRFWKEPLRAAVAPDSPENHVWKIARGLGKTVQSGIAEWYVGTTERMRDCIYTTPRMRQIRTYQKTIVRRMVNNSRGDPPFLRWLLADNQVNVQRNDLRGDVGPGSIFEARSAWSEGNQLQGYRGQFAIADEIQQWTQQAIENLKNAVDKPLYPEVQGPEGGGRRLMIGTPDFEGTLYHDYWQESDQREWFFDCPECETRQTPTLNNVRRVSSDPVEYVLCCSSCSVTIDKDHILTTGEWEPTNPEGVHRGYHLSQLVSPRHNLTAVMRERDRPTTPEGDFQRYRLANFHSGAAKPIPQQAIQRVSDSERALRGGPLPDTAHFVGIDFGGGESSDTVAVVGHCPSRDSRGRPSMLVVDTVRWIDAETRTDERRQLANLIDRFNVPERGRVVADMGFGSTQVGMMQEGDENPNPIPSYGWGSTVLGHYFNGSVSRDQPQYEYLQVSRDNIIKARKAPYCNRVIQLFPDSPGYDKTDHAGELPYEIARDPSEQLSLPHHDDPDTRETMDKFHNQLTSVKREFKESETSGRRKEYFTTFGSNQKDDGFMALVYLYTAAMIGATASSGSSGGDFPSIGGRTG